MSSDDPAVRTERRGHILLITLNRPAAMNAVNAELAQRLGEAITELDADPELRVGVLTGAGTKAFSAGADLKELAAGRPIAAPENPEWGFAGLVRRSVRTPLIAAVNGFALGGGTEIALACDLVVAAETANFGLPEVTRGIIAAAGGLIRLPRQIPVKKAMEIALTGRPMTAPEAADLGLVNHVDHEGDVLTAAIALAEQIAGNAPLAVQASKAVIYGSLDRPSPDDALAWTISDHESGDIHQTHDAQEGPRAFSEKRRPNWQGR